MSIVLAIPNLFDAVVARFALDGTLATNVFGWRSPAQQNTGNAGRRIAWVPGDEKSGNAGIILPPRNPGGNPRPLMVLEELCTCIISSNNPALIEDERAQYQATRELYCAWLRAVHIAAHGTYRVISTTWDVSKKERRYGTAIRVVIGVQAVIPDIAFPSAPVDASASIDVAALDVTENLSVSPGTGEIE